MVHLEPFYYPVWDPGQMAKNYALWGTQVHGREAEYILFDYQKRDPISHDAAAAPIGAWSDRGTV